MNTITALILTFNEEQHIERCIRSLDGVVERVCVIDSFSSDRTVEIAKSHAIQFQFGRDLFSLLLPIVR